MKSGSDILHKDTSYIVLEGFIQLTQTFDNPNIIPLITRSSKLFMLASAFSLTYGATISRSDVYYFIMKRPLTESSRIFITYSEMNYFYCLMKDLHRLNPSLSVFLIKLYNFLLFKFFCFL